MEKKGIVGGDAGHGVADAVEDAKRWVSERVAPVLHKMIADMVIERPKDPEVFMRQYFEKLERSKKSIADASKEGAPADANSASSSSRYEHDKIAKESDLDWQSLLHDGDKGELISSKSSSERSFAIAYSRAVFDGWVKQTSPACAAASVAGAVNACRGASREDDASLLRQDDVLAILRQILVDRASKRQARMERLLMLPEGGLTPLLNRLAAKLQDEGKPLGGFKGKCTAAKGAVKRLIQLVKEETANRTADDDGGIVPDEPEASTRLRELIDEEEAERSSASKHLVSPADAVAEMSADEDGDENDEETASSSSPRKWNFRKDAKLLLSSIGGLLKLDRKRPSTGAFGNWGIASAVDRILDVPNLAASECNDGFRTSLLVGKRSKGVTIGISTKDSDTKIASDWSKLWGAFMDPDIVIIFHLKNHYALIYAMRHWVDVHAETGERRVVREVLTSRRGQTPKHWISWEECRATMLGYSGYKMIAVKRVHG